MNKLETVGALEEFEYRNSRFLQHCTKRIIINFSCNLCNGSFSKEFNNYEKGKVRQLLFPSTTDMYLLFSYSINKHQWVEPWK